MKNISTRLRFGLFMAMAMAMPLPAAQIIMSEIMFNPVGTKAEWIEVTNMTTNRLDMANWKLASGASLTLPDFNAGAVNAHFLMGKERILLSSKSPADTRVDYPNIPPSTRIFGPWVGSLSNSGEKLTLEDKNGARLSSLTYGDGGRKWPSAADGTGHSLLLVNENREIDDWHNWKTSAVQGGNPGLASVILSEEAVADPTASLPVTYTEAIPMTASWSYYLDLNIAPPTDWTSRTFAPSPAWPSGPALLGFETAALPPPGLQTAVQNGALTTYYFRNKFNWTGGTTGAQFQIDGILDDGAVFYLNGTYIGNKDGGNAVVHNSSLATATVTDAALVTNILTGNLPAGLLVDGENVLAAVGLQVNTTSSDMIFGANLRLANVAASELVINEVRQAGAGIGYIEFYNPGATNINLLGYYLTDTVGTWTKFPITQSVVVPAGGLAVLGFTEMGFSATAATTTLYLARANGTPIAGLVAALPQDGRTMGRKPLGGNTWYRFSLPTPGQPNSSGGGASGNSALPQINEVHFSSATQADWVEVTNRSNASLNLSGYYLSSTSNFSNRVALTGTVSPNGYASVNGAFPLSTDGSLVVFLTDVNNNVISEAKVRRVAGKTSSQAWPAGSAEFYATTAATRDAVNVPDRNASIVISEIMYAPPSDHRQGEYVELYNRGAAAVDVGNWVFDSGLNFVIPSGTVIQPNSRLVVAQNAAFINANYPSAGAVVGDYGGSLGNGGELIRLVDQIGNLADEVDYGTGGDWPRAADSLGSSIELINPAMDNNAGTSWAASDDTQKGTWTSFNHSGIWHNQGNGGTVTERAEIHFNLVGDGHVVLRNINFGTTTLTALPNANVISPSNSGVDGWRVTGTHYATFVDAEGLHIIADGAGDMKGNAIELDVAALTQSTVPYAINFQARWVSGMGRLVMNTWDRTWGRTFAVPVPNGLGTPGQVNSRAAATARPEIWSMLHSPSVPKATDDVKITARVSSSLPLASVVVQHRLDTVAGTGAWTATPMNDTGTGGDAAAGDGIYTATISAYKSEGAIAQFYIEANATGGGTANYPTGGANLPGMWIVDSTPVSSDLLVQRFVVAQKDHDTMGGNGATAIYNYRHPRMSNHYYNATFIINESEITYNVESRKSGSPWTRDGGNSMDRIRTKFPKDRMFRGREKTGVDNDAADEGARRMNNRMSRYWLYLLGYPAAEAEFVHVAFNNLAVSLKDDTEPTDTDMLDRTYDNSSSGQLHEIDDAWYFGDTLSGENRSNIDGDWIYDARYMDNSVWWQGSWPIRTLSDAYDFSALTSWIRTMYNNGTTPSDGSAADATYRASVENQFDVDKFARYAAIKAWAGAWDNFTIDRGKNGYVYQRPTDGKWEFEFWDGDLDFQNVGQGMLSGNRGTQAFFSRPWFRRQMNYYLQEIRDKWSLDSPRVYSWLQNMEDQSSSYSVTVQYYKDWFLNRRPTVDGFIGAGNQTAAFTATASVGANTGLNFTNITGTVPSTVFNVTVDGHPEAAFRWASATNYELNNVFLRVGTNLFTVRGWDRLGNALGSQLVSVTKTGDAPPILAIVTNPASGNVSLGEALILSPAGSLDPEGTTLSLSWTVSPTTGVSNGASGLTGRRLVFSSPGIYTVTLSGTDGAGNTATLARQITVYSNSDFTSFGTGLTLPGSLTSVSTELRDNSSPASWYSLEDRSGRLLLQINENAAAPLDTTNFPSITRPLPTSSDWVMQTDAHLDTRHLGESFNAGLMVDTVENGQPIRYVYSLESGDQVRQRRSDFVQVFYTPSTMPQPLRINCGGAQITETDAKVWSADTGFLAVPATTAVTQTFSPSVGGTSQYFGILGDTRRSGVANGSIVYEIPVSAWPNGYNLTLYAALVNTPSVTVNMAVTVNDAATSTNWSVASSPSQMRSTALPSVSRNANGKIKLTIARVSSTPGAAEACISGIEIVPSTTPPSSGTLPALTPAPMQADSLRVERLGTSLVFSRKVNGVWIVDQTQTLPSGSTATKGGIFASTETPMNLRASFDYLLIADPVKVAPLIASLRLTEVMYHPDATGVEYLEFKNAGTSPINLQGVTLPATAPFSEYIFGNESLAPGEYLVLTQDAGTFRSKYSIGPRLAATGWLSGALNNAGEHIILLDPNGNPIHDFNYSSLSPWPTLPDGNGPALEVIDIQGDYNDPLNWRATASVDGTPGGAIRVQDPDVDGDGVPDWVETAFGLPSNSPGRQPAATSTRTAGQMTVHWPFTPGHSYRIECSTNLQDWDELATVTGGSFTDPTSLTEQHKYYRVTALLP